MTYDPGGPYPPPYPSYPPPAPAAPSSAQGVDWTVVVSAIGAGLVVLGSFLPWATATAPFLGRIEYAGTDGDGKITLALGAVMAVGLIRFVPWHVIGLLAALGAGGVAVYDIGKASDAIDEAEAMADGVLDVTVGVGLYVVLAGAIVGAVGLIGATARSRS